MRLLTTIILICFFIGAIAQEKEIWACQQIEGTLMNWENGSWNTYGTKPTPLLLTINGDIASVKEEDYESWYSCSKAQYEPFISCLSSSMGTHLYFNPETARLGKSTLLGAISKAEYRDSVSAVVYNCTKF